MEYLIVIICLILILIILKFVFGYSKKDIEKISKNPKLDNIAQKYPDNIKMCKEYLEMLGNKTVCIEEDKNALNSLYIAISNKIIIANLQENYTRLQTIAHECLHSVQNRNILLINFIYANIHLIYFIIISVLAIVKILPNKMIFLVILALSGFLYYALRVYLENDAMIKARYLVKEYMENKKISSDLEIKEMLSKFDELNEIGIKGTNYVIGRNIIVQNIFFCLICILRQYGF